MNMFIMHVVFQHKSIYDSLFSELVLLIGIHLIKNYEFVYVSYDEIIYKHIKETNHAAIIDVSKETISEHFVCKRCKMVFH